MASLVVELQLSCVMAASSW